MKASIALAILILLIAAGIGMQDHQRLTTVRAKHAELTAAASKLGITIDASRPTEDSVRITKRGREDKEATARQAAADFIAFAKEMEAIEKKNEPPDEAMQKRVMDFMDRMMSLDSSQLKILIAEVRAAKDLKDEMRQGLIAFSIMTLSNDHPQAALALFTESSDLFKEDGMGEHVISSSLAKWAKDDPMAALEWVRTNSKKFPDLITDDAKRGLITGTAAQDPKLAFKLIAELGLKESYSTVSSIIRAAKTSEERTATLAALREHEATIQDDKARQKFTDSALSNFADQVAGDGFEAGTQWIASADLTPAELENFAQGLNGSIKNGENGKWIEWIGEKLPPEKADDSVKQIVRQWTQSDYQAAGTWLAATPEGPTKNTAVRSYAETVSKYDPETAAQWAVTLPPGKDRKQTLKSIYQNWPKEDPADKQAAEAFKQEHGIK